MTLNTKADIGVPTNDNMGYVSIKKAAPIEFIENGIKFSVFLNGDFDFLSNSRAMAPRVYTYRNGIRAFNIYGTDRNLIRTNRLGQVISVNGITIDYNRYGNVIRIGSVYIDYRGNQMVQVGNLHIIYHPHGYVKYAGFVKPRMNIRSYDYRKFYNGMVLDYDDDYFYNDHFYNDFNRYNEDADYYYYKSKKNNDNTVIKRKKETKKEMQNNKKVDRKRRS